MNSNPTYWGNLAKSENIKQLKTLSNKLKVKVDSQQDSVTTPVRFSASQFRVIQYITDFISSRTTSKARILITGGAGAGKSQVLQEVARIVNSSFNKRIFVLTAPTGKHHTLLSRVFSYSDIS